MTQLRIEDYDIILAEIGDTECAVVLFSNGDISRNGLIGCSVSLTGKDATIHATSRELVLVNLPQLYHSIIKSRGLYAGIEGDTQVTDYTYLCHSQVDNDDNFDLALLSGLNCPTGDPFL